MSNKRCQSFTPIVCCNIAAICLICVFANGQAGRPGGNIDLKGEQRRMEARETMLRNLDVGTALDKKDQKRIEAAIEQVKQDFRQIQTVRNELVRNLLANKPLDFKNISDKTTEIHKSADRLKTFLMPYASEIKQKETKSPAQFSNDEIKGALVQLCNRVAIFVDNPVLKTPGITDVEQSMKAGADLLTIIELSDRIKRSAQSLGKTVK